MKGILIEDVVRVQMKSNDYAQAIARIAVAQVCENVGFKGFQHSALNTLSNVACKYIYAIGKTSGLYADIAGRVECNVVDIVQGLEDLNMSHGFVGASDRDSCFLRSGIVKEILHYVDSSEEIGFAYSVPSFPVTKEMESSALTFLKAGETTPMDAIPTWLPKFPDTQTYASIRSDIIGETRTQIQYDKIDEEQKVLQGNVSGRERYYNRFIAVPLQHGEKEISVISLPVKLKEEDVVQNYCNLVSELDTFVSGYKEVKSGGSESGEGSIVEVKFRIARKFLDGTKAASWFLNDEEEKRVEKLPRELMEYEDNRGIESVVN